MKKLKKFLKENKVEFKIINDFIMIKRDFINYELNLFIEKNKLKMCYLDVSIIISE
jgi:hypothetical protein